MHVCDIVVSPATRRRGFIARQAQLYSNYRPEAAESAIERMMIRQYLALVRIGLHSRDARLEIERLEKAIRNEIARLTCGVRHA